MADVSPIVVQMQVDTSGLKQGVSEAKANLKEFGDTASSQSAPTKSLTATIASLAESFVSLTIIQEASSYLKEAASAAIENSKSFTVMQTTLKSVTGATKEQIAATDEALGQMALQSNLMTSDLRPSFDKLLLTYKDTNVTLAQLAKAQDIAAGTGKPLTAVIQAMAREAAGSDNAWRRIAPSMAGVKNAGDKLAATYHGLTQELAQQDPVKGMDIAFEHMKETIGKAVVPMMQDFTNVLKDIVPWFEKNYNVISAIVKVVVPLVGAYKLLNIALEVHAAMAQLAAIAQSRLAVATGEAAVAQTALDVAMDANPIGALIALVAVLAGLFLTLAGNADKATAAMNGTGSAAGVNLTRGGGRNDQFGNRTWHLGGSGSTGHGMSTTVDYNQIAKDNAAAEAHHQAYLARQERWRRRAEKAAAEAALHSGSHVQAAHHSVKKAITDANAQFVKDMAAQLDKFRTDFATATKVNVGSLFQEGYNTADSLLKAMTDKLAQTQQLARDAATLAAEGFSTTFIDEVVAQGPVIGDQLAQSIIASGSTVQQQLQATYAANQAASNLANMTLSTGKVNGNKVPVGGAPMNVVVNAQTNASPNLIANTIVNTIKFNSPITVANAY